jgi:serine/threonine protein kinase
LTEHAYTTLVEELRKIETFGAAHWIFWLFKRCNTEICISFCCCASCDDQSASLNLTTPWTTYSPLNLFCSSHINKQLGEGAFSVVIEATKRGTDEHYAVKVVTKSKLTKEDEIALKDEIDVLNELKHEHIIRLYNVYEEPSYYYLITEQMKGGELFDRIVSKSFYNEKEARDVCKILFEAIGYCHSRSIAHRDLKVSTPIVITVSTLFCLHRYAPHVLLP